MKCSCVFSFEADIFEQKFVAKGDGGILEGEDRWHPASIKGKVAGVTSSRDSASDRESLRQIDETRRKRHCRKHCKGPR